jgi:molybdenum cofactor cytidylyltransferase
MEVIAADTSCQVDVDGERVYFCSERCRSTYAERLASTATGPRVTGLVLAAGASSRLGRPKQILAFRERTLLDATLETARGCGFDQLVCTLGGSADLVRATVDLHGVEVVENRDYREGCSSSIAAALRVVDPPSEVLVLLLGDQPGVEPATVSALLAARGDAPLAVCRHDDARGHPLAFARRLFGELGALHGDKGVWKLSIAMPTNWSRRA